MTRILLYDKLYTIKIFYAKVGNFPPWIGKNMQNIKKEHRTKVKKEVVYYPEKEYDWIEKHMKVDQGKIVLRDDVDVNIMINSKRLQKIHQLEELIRKAEKGSTCEDICIDDNDFCMKDAYYELLSFYYGQVYKKNDYCEDSIGKYLPISQVVKTHSTPNWRVLLENTIYAELVGRKDRIEKKDKKGASWERVDNSVEVPNLMKYITWPYFILKIIYECYFKDAYFQPINIEDAFYWIIKYYINAYKAGDKVVLSEEQWIYFGTKLFGESFEDLFCENKSLIINHIDDEVDNFGEDVLPRSNIFYSVRDYEARANAAGKMPDEEKQEIIDYIVRIFMNESFDDAAGKITMNEPDLRKNDDKLVVPQYMDLVFKYLCSNSPMKPTMDAWSRGKASFSYEGQYRNNEEFVKTFCMARNLIISRNMRSNSVQNHDENYNRFKRVRTATFKELYMEEEKKDRLKNASKTKVLSYMEACSIEKVFGFQLIWFESFRIQRHLFNIGYDIENHNLEKDLKVLGDELKYIFFSEGIFMRIPYARAIIDKFFEIFNTKEKLIKAGELKYGKRLDKYLMEIERLEKMEKKALMKERRTYETYLVTQFTSSNGITADLLKKVLSLSPEAEDELQKYAKISEKRMKVAMSCGDIIIPKGDGNHPEMPKGRKYLEGQLAEIEKWVIMMSYKTIEESAENVEISTHTSE